MHLLPNGHIFVDSPSIWHQNSTSKVRWDHQFWKANLRGNYHIDSTWKFWHGFDFQNRRNIDEFSTWIFLHCFNVESAEHLYSLFPFYYFLRFLLWESILRSCGIVLSQCNFNDINVITDIGTIGNISFGNFATIQIVMNKDNFYLFKITLMQIFMCTNNSISHSKNTKQNILIFQNTRLILPWINFL